MTTNATAAGSTTPSSMPSKVNLYQHVSRAVVGDDRASMADTTDNLREHLRTTQVAELKNFLDAIPRRKYVQEATAIEPLERLSRALGGPELFIKRDDLLPLAGGGSKTRKLDLLVAQALEEGADMLVTCGAVQSNHCRLTASAAAREGLDCHLILEERVPGSYSPDAGGNNYAFALLGATTTVVPNGGIPDAEAAVLADLRSRGRKPYWIPGGGSNVLGALGYARCAAEILDYTAAHGDFDAIVTCSGSGGTHSGLVAGLRAAGDATAVHGVSVRFSKEVQTERIVSQYEALARHIGLATPTADDIIVHDEFVGPGYSLPTEAMNEAITLFARLESTFLDPVYTGKGAAGLIGLVRSGVFRPGQRVLFLHTGGAPSLFHYQPLLDLDKPTPSAVPKTVGSKLSASELAEVYGSK